MTEQIKKKGKFGKVLLIILGVLFLMWYLGNQDLKEIQEPKDKTDLKTSFINSFDYSFSQEQAKKLSEEISKNNDTDFKYTIECMNNCDNGTIKIIIDKSEKIGLASDVTNKFFINKLVKNLGEKVTITSHLWYDGTEFSLCVGPIYYSDNEGDSSIKCFE